MRTRMDIRHGERFLGCSMHVIMQLRTAMPTPCLILLPLGCLLEKKVLCSSRMDPLPVSQISLRVAMSMFNQFSSWSIMLVFLDIVPSSSVWICRCLIFQQATVNTEGEMVTGWWPEHARLPVHASSRAATAFLEERPRSASVCFLLLLYIIRLQKRWAPGRNSGTNACSGQMFPSGPTQHLIQRNAWAWQLECHSVACSSILKMSHTATHNCVCQRLYSVRESKVKIATIQLPDS